MVQTSFFPTREFSHLLPEVREKIVQTGLEDLTEHVNAHIFDFYPDLKARLVGILPDFDRCFQDAKATKGDVVSTCEFEVNLDSILHEIIMWSRLAGEFYMDHLANGKKQLLTVDCLEGILGSLIVDKIEQFVTQTPARLRPNAYNLLVTIPTVLDAATSPSTGGIMVIINRQMGIFSEDVESFRPYLRSIPGETLLYLDRVFRRNLETFRELAVTQSLMENCYLISPGCSLERFDLIKNDTACASLIQALDGKICSYLSMTRKSPDKHFAYPLTKLMEELVDDKIRLHPEIFSVGVLNTRYFVQDFSHYSLPLDQFTQKVYDFYHGRKKSGWRECILSDNSSVGKFQNANLIKNWARGEIESAGTIGDREGIYVIVLHEMREVKGHNDKVFNHLADLLTTHPTKDLDALKQIAFQYGSYVAKGGSPDCLKGLYGHKTYHQLQVLDILDASLSLQLCEEKSYCTYVTGKVQTLEDDLAEISRFFERERTRIGEIRVQVETMRYLG